MLEFVFERCEIGSNRLAFVGLFLVGFLRYGFVKIIDGSCLWSTRQRRIGQCTNAILVRFSHQDNRPPVSRRDRGERSLVRSVRLG
jgi:hypothetical protein